MPKTTQTKTAETSPPRRTIRILSAGAKGGPGKSFLVKNLAGAAVTEGLRVATVDFDTQRTVTKWIARRDAHAGTPAAGSIENYIANPGEEQAAHDVIAISDVDIVFIDTPPSIDHYPKTMKILAQNVDLVLVPTKVGISDTESAEELLRVLSSWDVPTLVVINLVKVSAKRLLSKAQRRIVGHAELSPVVIPDYADFLLTDELGLGATEVRKCSGSEAIEAVWATVKRKLKLRTNGAKAA